MTFRKGDFVLIDYDAKVKETLEFFDTTIEETAKKERLKYSPAFSNLSYTLDT